MTTEAKLVLTAQDRTAAAFRSAQANLSAMSSAARKVNSALGTIGVGLSIGIIATKFAEAAHSAIEFGDEMAKAAARTGIQASKFATLADAAKQADIDVGSLSKALKAMQVAVSQASGGSKEAVDTFKALGIEFSTFKQLSPEQQFLKLADQISKLQDPADRVRAAVQLFGKAGADLLPFFEDGAKGIQSAREEIERLGLALTDAEIEQLSAADDAIKRLDTSTSALGRSLTALIAGPLTTFLDKLTIIAQVIKREGLFATWGDFARADEQAAMSRARLSANAAFPDARQGPQGRGRAAGAGVTPPGFQPTDKPNKGKVPDPLPEFQFYASHIENLDNAVADAIEQINRDAIASSRDFMRIIGNETSDTLAQFSEDTKQAAAEIHDTMSTFADQAARNIQDSFAQFLFDPFSNGLKGMLAGFIDTIRQMVAEAASAEILKAFFNWGASSFSGSIGGFFGSMAKSIGTRASGGPVGSGKPYLVGERGPELFVPSGNGMIIPNGGGAGAVVVNYSIDARGADADRIMSVLPVLLKQTEDRTIARVRELQTRGRM